MELDLRQLFAICRRWWWLLLMIPLLAGIGGVGVSARQQKQYVATARLRVSPNQTAALDYNAVLGVQVLVDTYQHVMVSRPVLAPVISQLQLPYSFDELQRAVSASAIKDTELLSVSVTDTDPEMAARIANALVAEFIRQMAQPAITFTVIDPAVPPLAPSTPRVKLAGILAIAAGVAIAIVAVAVLEYLDDTVRMRSDFAALTGGPLLATVGRLPKGHGKSGRLVVRDRPDSAGAEAIMLLRANLELISRTNGFRSLAITSPGLADGKSTIAANLAIALAEAGLATVLVDADLRRPSLHRLFGVSNRSGWARLLAHPETPWHEAATDVGVRNLVLIPSGWQPSNPAALINYDRLRLRVAEIAAEADVVVFDTPPLLSVSDAFVVATSVDGVVFVGRTGRTRLSALRGAAMTLRRGGARIVGVVLNGQNGPSPYGTYTPDQETGVRAGREWTAAKREWPARSSETTG